jgi:hypothetical protein
VGQSRGIFSMKLSAMSRPLLLAAFAAVFVTSASYAAEPRPWLCHDKPVFSSDRPMTYEATATKGREWHLFFMQFDPNGPHDGFSIVQSRDLPRRGGTVSGHLPAGRYFSVALFHSASGYWICPGQTSEKRDSLPLGLITSLCFGEGGGSGCRVRLTVKSDNTTAAP